MRENELEQALTKLAKDTILETFFKAHSETQPAPIGDCVKRNHSIIHVEAGNEDRAGKRKCM